MRTHKTNMKKRDIRFAFFGTSHIAVYVLSALDAAGLTPALVVTIPAKPQGRGLEMRETEVEAWAKSRGIPVAYDWKEFESAPWDVAVVADYGRILPASLLQIPKHGFLNVHPSLLPRFRGPSPMRSAILADERATGVTIILVDERMDHGPIVAQKRVELPAWPIKNSELERHLLQEGGALLAAMLPKWVSGEIDAAEQNHDVATYCEKFSKEDGLLDLSGDGYQNLLKVYAFEGWPGTYTFFKRGGKRIRVAIQDAHLESGSLVIDYVVPEGKGVMSYEDFLRSGAKPVQ